MRVWRITVEQRVWSVVFPDQLNCGKLRDDDLPESVSDCRETINRRQVLGNGLGHLPASSGARGPGVVRDRTTSHAASGLTTTDEEPVSSINRIGRLRLVADLVELLATVGREFTFLDEFSEQGFVSNDAKEVDDSTVQIIE